MRKHLMTRRRLDGNTSMVMYLGSQSTSLRLQLPLVWNPVVHSAIAEVVEGSIEDYEDGMKACSEAAKIWMQVPAPKRGDIVRQIGDALRGKLEHLGASSHLRWGKYFLKASVKFKKSLTCDFSVGLSRQLNRSKSCNVGDVESSRNCRCYYSFQLLMCCSCAVKKQYTGYMLCGSDDGKGSIMSCILYD